MSHIGGLCMSGNGWCSQVLNVLVCLRHVDGFTAGGWGCKSEGFVIFGAYCSCNLDKRLWFGSLTNPAIVKVVVKVVVLRDECFVCSSSDVGCCAQRVKYRAFLSAEGLIGVTFGGHFGFSFCWHTASK